MNNPSLTDFAAGPQRSQWIGFLDLEVYLRKSFRMVPDRNGGLIRPYDPNNQELVTGPVLDIANITSLRKGAMLAFLREAVLFPQFEYFYFENVHSPELRKTLHKRPWVWKRVPNTLLDFCAARGDLLDDLHQQGLLASTPNKELSK